ncbi:N-acetylglucosamine-6-phosphate deacetylase [Sphingomonas sp.]|uniref:N-acetylglucosamine-6-phosphate deacetylase n=1 Tax=Sphingomonas sp. TaxID=28214 RepID=UPI0035BC0E13
MRALVNARVAFPDRIVTDTAVLVADGCILDLIPVGELPPHAEREDLGGGLLAPGFIDIQVNGGGGVLFNDAPTVDTIARIGEAHRRFGTTGFLPTLISDELDVVRAGVAAVDAAIDAGVPGVLGIHVEGPFLNRTRKGIHDPTRIRDLDEEGIKAVTALRRGRTLLTLAPERTTPTTIRRLADAGVIIGAGHTDATYEEMMAAIDAGLSGCTHLFNAMSPLRSRAPGAVGAMLDNARVWCGLIADGQHVHPAAMRLALAAKGIDQLVLVTDAMPSVGHVKNFDLQGRAVIARDGACFAADETLAGSDLDMAGAVRNARVMLAVGLHEAILMASANPARLLGLEREVGGIVVGNRADLVLLDGSGTARRTWIGGEARDCLPA